jgi:peptide/nickel transport system substrate-binding protein
MLPVSLVQGVAGGAGAANDFLKSLPQYNLDLTKAKAELAQSATPQGFSVEIPYTTSSPWAEPTMLNLQQNLKGLGITVTPKPETPEQWAAQVFAHQVPTGMQSMQLIATIPDPNAVLPRIVGQANIPKPGLNLANWTTPQIEQDVATLTQSTDTGARWRATQSILSQIADQVPYVPLYAPNFVTALGKGFGYAEPLVYSDLTDGGWVFKLRAAG